MRYSDKIFQSDIFRKLISPVSENIFFTGLNGSSSAFLTAALQKKIRKFIFLSNEQTKLFRLKDDINLINENEIASLYLGKFDEEFESDVSPVVSILKKLSSENEFILLLDPSALLAKVIDKNLFHEKLILLEKGNEYSYDELVTKLNSFGYTRKEIVEEEKDFAVRGGIIDLFPEDLNQPVRIEFFVNTVESIREFDLITQRSISQRDKVEILPSSGKDESLTNILLDYIKDDVSFIIDEPDILFSEYKDIFNLLDKYNRSYISVFPKAKSESLKYYQLKEIDLRTKSQPSVNSNIKLLYEDLNRMVTDGFEIYLMASDDYQAKRFKELIDDIDEKEILGKIHYEDNSLHSGFILPYEKIAVYTEHEVFGRYFKAQKRRRKFAGITFKELNKLNYGDFMVHKNFGIGKYAGLRKIKVGKVEQEAVKLLYKGNDSVFVNLSSLNQINKYSGQEGYTPSLSKLGGNEWEKIKQRTKKKIQDIARDLILLYSKRKSQSGFRFSSDTVWQKELEASFIYEDTPDQITATESVKIDMESDSPMDRLICGDVGFGKTEIAVRSAFKAVNDNKQVAVLVPTTILAEQHYNTFRDRLSSWAVEVEHLSRFKTKKEQTEILKRVGEGKINIIIGTHRLLSKDVKFKDLGLLVIDEEQRFGVKAKEKIKMIKENVDVLTLTATPIPRTLNFSLLGARDLSIINTPPKNRQPIHTEIINFDKKTIAEAITRELQRNGQVYFVNDKIAKLEELAEIIEKIVPFAKIAIAHGKMTPAQLENVMLKFLEKKTNVLLCTKIIESGLDIPNVNTIIINRADNFGLAELYQLRGRVGRSNIKSFTYLVTPPQSSLTKQAIRRLHALEEFSELGSGMNLALRDMEIRGAGNLLGREQSGFILEIGFDMYMQILDEAVTELKESELGDALGEFIPKSGKPRVKYFEVKIESDIGMLIPENYIDDENLRLEIYQKLSNVRTEEEIILIREELLDRFGKFPDEVESLFKHIEIKIKAVPTGFEKIVISGNNAEFHFRLDDNEIFTNGKFEVIAQHINSGNKHKFVQTKKGLFISVTLNSDDKFSCLINFLTEYNSLLA